MPVLMLQWLKKNYALSARRQLDPNYRQTFVL